jgi:hypothetical protein
MFLRKSDQFPSAVRGEVLGPVTIDLEALGDRIVPLPVPARNYVKLVAGKAGVLFLLETAQLRSGSSGLWRSSEPWTLHRFELPTKKTIKITEGIRGFDLSFDGERLLYERGQQWTVSAAGHPPPGRGSSSWNRCSFVSNQWRSGGRCSGRCGTPYATSSTTLAITGSI